MKKTLFTTLLLVASLFTSLSAQSQEQLLLSGWRFQKGAAVGAEAPDFDDSRWQQVTIPHDWAISGPFDKDIDKQVVRIEQNGEKEATEKTGRSGCLPWIGEGWYRTQFTIPAGYDYAELIFDGAMAEPHVYVDGKDVGYWAYGYNTFKLEIPAESGEHTLAVHLQNIEESSRWYPGAGLYRPVRLFLAQQIGLKTWGTFDRTTMVSYISPDYRSAREARLTVSSEVRGDIRKDQKLKIGHLLTNEEGEVVAEHWMDVNDSKMATNVLVVRNPKLWSPEQPALYTLTTRLTEGDKVWDEQSQKVGIRQIEYNEEGFKLNGELRKFRGVCLHHDMGPVGSAFNKSAFRRQVALLKEIGCDAIRTSHNMPAPWQMDICDEMGMMVMAESMDMWVYPKCKNGYSRFFEKVDDTSVNRTGEPWWKRDFTNLVLVHRNHPSIVMWSIGNEIPEQNNAVGYRYTHLLQQVIHELDGTRPCTQGMDRGEGPMHSGVWQTTDIPGFNYRLHVYPKGIENSPKGIVLGSETASTISSRGVYKFPVEEVHGTAYDDGQISSYDLESCIWSNIPDDDWMWQDKCPQVIGEFVWTGFDYLGEPTPYDEYWPSRSSYFGIFDLAGLPKDRAYLYRVHWAPEQETLHLLPHWTWPGREGEVTPVFCYTNYPEAELFVNGKSQGRIRKYDVSLETYLGHRVSEPMPWGGSSMFADPKTPYGENRLDRYRLRWMDVRYEPGELKVVAYDAMGNKAAEQVIRTAGKPDHIELCLDAAAQDTELSVTPVDMDGNTLDTPQLAFVTARVVDKDGNLCPDADVQLQFNVSGKPQRGIKAAKGEYVARYNSACNGDATSVETFTEPTMKAFHGECVIVVEAGTVLGDATLTVSGKGVKPARMNFTVR